MGVFVSGSVMRVCAFSLSFTEYVGVCKKKCVRVQKCASVFWCIKTVIQNIKVSPIEATCVASRIN